ncbi:hypothetical protein GY45DRAFT_121546 [Cubamyces sp. BRFM 1775]|nr:hypothetical protein GY45DRAFT_121546 [Cubamyces sp. BRFM 1775]
MPIMTQAPSDCPIRAAAPQIWSHRITSSPFLPLLAFVISMMLTPKLVRASPRDIHHSDAAPAAILPPTALHTRPLAPAPHAPRRPLCLLPPLPAARGESDLSTLRYSRCGPAAPSTFSTALTGHRSSSSRASPSHLSGLGPSSDRRAMRVGPTTQTIAVSSTSHSCCMCARAHLVAQ